MRVVLYPGENGYIVAECPELPGCASQGHTRNEALRNIREAIGEGIHATLSVPLHRELDRGLLRALIRAAGMTVDKFVALDE